MNMTLPGPRPTRLDCLLADSAIATRANRLLRAEQQLRRRLTDPLPEPWWLAAWQPDRLVLGAPDPARAARLRFCAPRILAQLPALAHRRVEVRVMLDPHGSSIRPRSSRRAQPPDTTARRALAALATEMAAHADPGSEALAAALRRLAEVD
ncbi:MAG: hypothetical protein SV108_07425 [Pseudomonadota bacterium]|nr:hypothetical protein [Pseudomonadota bacterium]